ncbi:P-loop containing nucleoside triphosphate hydrolase protein [Lentinula raphanica]|nr:P-loop containing nucleoside triphosphate hydrolase protein [Lentinula raphanica]
MLPESDEEARSQAFNLFGKYPCLWQIKAARAILNGQDILTIAPTGAGKSLAYWLPLVFVEHGTIIVVTPLKELGAQFEAQLNAVGCNALNVTAHTAEEVYTEIANLKYRVVIFGPETMSKDHRYNLLLHNRTFMRSVIDVVIDESHVIHEWGGTFRPEYHSLGPARYALPRHIPYHLGTATLPPLDAKQLREHLNMGLKTVEIRLDTDRKNIFHRIQKMRHPINSYRDLAPLIAPHAATKKFIVFFNSRNAAQEGAQFLRSRLSEDQVESVTWVHLGMSDEFRHEEVQALKIGARLGVCATDAVGMGIDIPDIYIVVQYGVPTSLSTWYQRLGRGVRDLTLDGCAILLVEPAFFDEAKLAAVKAAEESMERTRSIQKLTAAAAAEAREIQRSSSNPLVVSTTVKNGFHKRKLDSSDQVGQRSRRKRDHVLSVEPDLHETRTLDFNGNEIKIERALDDYINAEHRPGKKCRREIGCVHFGNLSLKTVINRYCCTRSGCTPPSVEHCCDLCEPDYWPFLINETFVSTKQTRMPNPKAYERGEKEKKLWDVLDREHERWFMEKFGPYAMITPDALWPTSVTDRIVDWAHENKLKTMDDFRKRMNWALTETLGDKILHIIAENYHYEPPAPKPRKPRVPKPRKRAPIVASEMAVLSTIPVSPTTSLLPVSSASLPTLHAHTNSPILATSVSATSPRTFGATVSNMNTSTHPLPFFNPSRPMAAPSASTSTAMSTLPSSHATDPISTPASDLSKAFPIIKPRKQPKLPFVSQQ